jgi:MFS family permease
MKQKTRKNIRLAYSLIFINNSFFCYAPWLLFLLRYIDITQAATLQSVGILTSVIAEIPTGAIADLVGKKKTLHMSFLLTSFGEIFMALSSSFTNFIIGYIILNIGYSLYSGTMEAFTYDTLVSSGDEDGYDKVVSKSHAISDAGIAISSIIGGFMYPIWPGLPWFATGVAKFVGFIVSFFIDEPAIDTEKFSFSNFVKQTRKGFKHLFSTKLRMFTIFLLTFGAFHVVAYEIVDDITVIDYGYSAQAIGILYSIAIFAAVPASLLYEKISKKIEPLKLIFIAVFALAVNYMFTKWIGVTIWTGLFLLRILASPLRNNAISQILNKNTDSSIRATTLSTYSMLKVIPYVLLGGVIGSQIEGVGVRTFSTVFFTILLITIVPQMILLMKKRFTGDNL